MTDTMYRIVGYCYKYTCATYDWFCDPYITFFKWFIYNNWLQAGSYLRWSGFECSLFSCSSEVVADGCTGSSWSHNNRRTYSASAKQAENVSTTTKRRLFAFTGYWWLPTRNHTHLWGSFNTLELRTHTFISPSLPKVVQTLLQDGLKKINSFLDEKGSKCKHGWADYTCALSNWSLSMSHVHTIVPVRPIEKNKPLHTSDTSCIHKPHWIPPNDRPFPPLQWMEITFLESAAIHSLTQAVYRSISLTALITNRDPIKPQTLLKIHILMLSWEHTYSSVGTLWSSIITRSTL